MIALLVALAITVGSAAPSTGVATHPEPALEQRVVDEVNRIRSDRRFTPLVVDRTLAAVARAYSCRMAREGFLSHESPSGETFRDRVRATGKSYRLVGENLARNNAADPVTTAVSGWRRSSEHRENIFKAAFTQTGVGVCRAGRDYYFTQLFMQPS